MAVEAVVSVVIQKLTDMLMEESIIFDNETDEVEDIRIRLRRMRGFLTDAEKEQDRDGKFKKWVEEYLRTVYGVEDVIETFVLRFARRRRSEGFFQKRVLLFKDLAARQNLRKELERIRHKIHKLNSDKPTIVQDASFNSIASASTLSDGGQRQYQRKFSGCPEGGEEAHAVHRIGGANGSTSQVPVDGGGDRDTSYNHALRTRHSSFQSISPVSSFRDEVRLPRLQSKQISSYFVEEFNMIGFKEYEEKLVAELTSSSDLQRRVISIVGDAGSGKTTLARTIFSKRDIKRNFAYRAWIFVSNDYTVKDLFLSILKQVTKRKDQGVQNDQELAKMLWNCLKTKRYLLVMDDVRTADVWASLKDALPDTGLGSRVMFTAREENAASFSDSLHRLSSLSERNSWELFLNKVGLAANSPSSDSDILGLKERILKICDGSPLATVLLGGLLSTKKFSYDEWSQVLDIKNSQSLDIMSLSYNDLPYHSKLCLLFLALFPREFEIPVRRLFRLWLAEGFVKESLGKSPEDLAEEYFNDLVYRNMIQLSKLRSDGTPKKCRMPGVVYDQLLSKTQDIGLFHVHSNSAEEAPPKFGVRRIVAVDKSYHSCSLDTEHLRSFLSFNTQNKDTPAKEIGNFLGRIIGNKGFGLLRLLDLEGVYKPSLPDKLGNLFHLRYLGLRWTFLDELPQSVGDLPYLQTLDVKHTYINKIPNPIWNSRHLRHLNLNDIRLDMPAQRNGSLTPLLTLWGLFVDEKSPVKNGLNGLTDLRELGITCHLSCTEELTSWIAGLTALQSLRLRCRDEMSRPSKLSLKPLSSLKQLSHLYLLGHLPKLLDKCEFPPSLKVLTLSVSRLEEDPMPTLGQLPSLSVLRLYASSYLGKKMICQLEGFANLRVLKLWMLQNLEEWDVKEGAMKKLKKLEIRGCEKLKRVPLKLLQLSSLEDLILTNMPGTFVTDVQRKKPQNISLTDNSDWEFTPLPEKNYLQPRQQQQEDPHEQAHPPVSCERPLPCGHVATSLCNTSTCCAGWLQREQIEPSG